MSTIGKEGFAGVVLTGVGSFMAALDTLVVASALTTIQRDLGASLTDLEWTVNAYSLSLAVLMIPAAVLGDRLGRARTTPAGWSCSRSPPPGARWPGTSDPGGDPGPAGRRRGDHHAAGPGAAHLGVPARRRGAAIGLFGAVMGLAVAAGRWWRCGHRGPGLAVDLLAQRTDRLAAPLVLGSSERVPGAGPTCRVVLLGPRLRHRVGPGPRRPAGWGSAEVLGPLSGARPAGRVRGLGTARAAPDAADVAAAPRGFTAGNVAALTFAPLFSAVFFSGQLSRSSWVRARSAPVPRLMAWTGTFVVVAPAPGPRRPVGERLRSRGADPAGRGHAVVRDQGRAWTSTISMMGPFIVGGLGVSLAIPRQSAAVAAVADRDVATASGVNGTMRELGGVFGIAVTVAVFGALGGFASPADSSTLHGALLAAAGLSLLGAVAGQAAEPAARLADTPRSMP